MYLLLIILLKNIYVFKNWKVICSKYVIKVLKFVLYKLINLFLIFLILYVCNKMFKELVECKRIDLIIIWWIFFWYGFFF